MSGVNGRAKLRNSPACIVSLVLWGAAVLNTANAMTFTVTTDRFQNSGILIFIQ
jgi:hypothetical protein